ncbi:MAG: hypothetical protein R3C13_14305 [Hyphomonas sp.]|uniref:hypothetical protein n=1 Tax=Hyphomonas sp. TaxID=87 RepID=UPI003528F970
MSHVRIATFYGPEEAYCARGLLQASGFDAVILNEHHLNMNPALRVALGGYELAVPAPDETAARTLLRETTMAPPPAADDDHICLRCGARELVRLKNWLWIPLIVQFGIPFIPARRKLKCQSCGFVMPG